LKFDGRTERAPLLADRLLWSLRASEAQTRVDLVLPIPLSEARLRERGFNQAWEIARRVARGLGRPACSDVLIRTVHTPPQTGLTRAARASNLRGAFAVRPQARTQVEGRHIALVDDIMTTGATFSAATLALKQAGAEAVSVWAVARTPEPANDAP
jgi:ComF family protein